MILRLFLGAISNGKNDLLTPKDFKEQAASPLKSNSASLCRISAPLKARSNYGL